MPIAESVARKHLRHLANHGRKRFWLLCTLRLSPKVEIEHQMQSGDAVPYGVGCSAPVTTMVPSSDLVTAGITCRGLPVSHNRLAGIFARLPGNGRRCKY